MLSPLRRKWIPSIEDLARLDIPLTREKWEKKFETEWPKVRWRVDFFRLPQYQQELAERHFPEDVEKAATRQGARGPARL